LKFKSILLIIRVSLGDNISHNVSRISEVQLELFVIIGWPVASPTKNGNWICV